MNIKIIDEYTNSSILKESANYKFFGRNNSLLNEWIDTICDYQEKCFENIQTVVNQKIDLKINYHFVDNPYDCGKQFIKLNPDAFSNESEARVNAFGWYPNNIFATFNDEIKCIGHHEDVHLIMYHLYKSIPSAFLCEGIAVSFDEYWQGISIHTWIKYYLSKYKLIDLNKLLNDSLFHANNGMLSYPIAGSFSKWIINTYGFSEFEKMYVNNYGYDELGRYFEEYLKYISHYVDNDGFAKISYFFDAHFNESTFS
jgi:hypothetical protein